MPKSSLAGHCLCTAVAFEIRGDLSSIELCHCAKCKRAYGAAFAATVYARIEDFAWTKGAERVAVYDAPLESSPPAYRHCFCDRCGSPLPITWEGFSLAEIPTATLERDSTAQPAYHMFVTQRARWCEILDALPQHPEGAPLREKVFQALF